MKQAYKHLERARDIRDTYVKEMVEEARWDRIHEKHSGFVRQPKDYLKIPSGRAVQTALQDAEKEVGRALANRAKAEIAIQDARLARKHFRKTQGRFCIDFEA